MLSLPEQCHDAPTAQATGAAAYSGNGGGEGGRSA